MNDHRFTREWAISLFDALVLEALNVSVHYSHHAQHVPSENYAVIVPVGPGVFPAGRLARVIAIASDHSCDVHLIGDGLRLFPSAEAARREAPR